MTCQTGKTYYYVVHGRTLRGSRLGKLFVAFLAVSIVLGPDVLLAKGRRGAHVILSLKDAREVRGELIAVRGNSLLLARRSMPSPWSLDSAGTDMSFDVADVAKLRLRSRKKKKFPAAVMGALVGTMCGAGYGAAKSGSHDELPLIVYTPLGAALGALIIGGIASIADKSRDDVIVLDGMTEPQLRQTLIRLRKEARDPI
ncbi:MAG: hypothetical protein IMZ43_08785 [Thermoplasmata archaeon]|nr:hypothetical protein [Thermoplasmata archaeon]